MLLKNKVELQIEDIRDPILFGALQSEGHAIDRHVLSDEQLRRAVWNKPRQKDDDIVMVTRFRSKESALRVIADTLKANIDEIVTWLSSSCEDDLVVTATYEESTGDGLVKNTDWSKTIDVHSAIVVLRKNFRLISRSFIIVTAYPFRSFDDVDVIYQAIDDYASKKNKK